MQLFPYSSPVAPRVMCFEINAVDALVVSLELATAIASSLAGARGYSRSVLIRPRSVKSRPYITAELDLLASAE